MGELRNDMEQEPLFLGALKSAAASGPETDKWLDSFDEPPTPKEISYRLSGVRPGGAALVTETPSRHSGTISALGSRVPTMKLHPRR